MTGDSATLLERWITSGAMAWIRTTARQLLLKPFVTKNTRVRVEGLEHLRGLKGQVIVVANHASDLDTALIFDKLPRRISRKLATGAAADRFFTKARNAALPSLLFNIYPVDRPGKAIGRSHHGLSKKLLDHGMSLLIYPQGTRKSQTGGPFSSGPARLAASRGIPVVPVRLTGTQQAWSPTERRPSKGRPRVVISFGPPIIPRHGELAATLTLRIRKALALHEDTTD